MAKNQGLSFILFSKNLISTKEVNNYFNYLKTEGFLGYDFDNNSYTDISAILSMYPDEPRYNIKINNVKGVVTNGDSKNYVLFLLDGGSKESVKILSCCNEFCKIISELNFCFLDQEGDPPKDFEKTVRNLDLKHLFQYNYFGQGFIEKFGKDFFTNLPCVKQEFITDNIIRIDLVKDIFEPIDETLKAEIDAYLAKFSIKVRFYDYRQHYID